MRDRLTSAYTRHFINDHTQKLIGEAQSSHTPLSLIVVDIDYFKRINDTYGHTFGDSVLVAIATALIENAGDQGIVARMGGEEFMMVLPGCDEFSASGRADKLREIIEDLEPSGMRVTASFGVAQLQEGETYEGVFGRADMNMYRAKRSGRNRVVSSTDADEL